MKYSHALHDRRTVAGLAAAAITSVQQRFELRLLLVFSFSALLHTALTNLQRPSNSLVWCSTSADAVVRPTCEIKIISAFVDVGPKWFYFSAWKLA